MRNRTLVDLFQRAQTGDVAAAGELLRRFRPLIRKLARGLPPSDREDLEQELSLHLLQVIERYGRTSQTEYERS